MQEMTVISQVPEEPRILGSCEPLTPEQRVVRLRELAAWGVDVSLAEAQLEKTPAECLQELRAFQALAEAAARAHAEGRVAPHRPRRPITPLIDEEPPEDALW